MKVDGADALGRDLNSLARELITASSLNELGLGAIHIIRERTRSSTDWHGVPFQRYSPGHIRTRRKAGISDPAKVILQLSSLSNKGGSRRSMMEEIGHTVMSNLAGVEVHPTSSRAEELLVIHNITGAGKSRVRRENWNLNEGDIGTLVAGLQRHVDDVLRLHNLIA
jgi:hypothetical protein